MPKLPRQLKPREVIKALQRLGFSEVGGKGSHIRFKHKDGRWTQVAVHPKPVPQGTFKAILRQAKIDLTMLPFSGVGSSNPFTLPSEETVISIVF